MTDRAVSAALSQIGRITVLACCAWTSSLVRPLDGAWKLTDIEILQEERL